MAAPATLGVPTLSKALARAARAGASVIPVHATGEVRVTHGDTRLTINARRKDATRELVALVAELEAQAPPNGRPGSQQLPLPVMRLLSREDPDAKPIRPVVTITERVRSHLLATTTPDADGWRPYESKALGAELGLTSTQVAVWANQAVKQGTIQVRRLNPELPAKSGSRIVAVRFREDAARVTQARAADTPLVPVPAPQPLGVQAPEPLGVLPTPTLATYAAARKLAADNPMLVAQPSDKEMAELLSEAARLYWWVRAGSRDG